MSTRVITPIGILSYPHFDKPQTPTKPNQQAKYSGTLVFDAAAQKTPQFAAMQEAVIEAATEKFGAQIKVGGKTIDIAQAFLIEELKNPFRKDAVRKGYAEGSVFINCRTQDQPQLIDGNKTLITDAQMIRTLFYPGSKARFSVTAFGYDTEGNRGVSFALNNVQWAGHGDRLDTRKAAVDEFDALDVAPEDIEALLGTKK